MEANGQQKTPRGQGLVLQAHWQTRKVGIRQHCDRCLERRTEWFANWAARRGPETVATLAVARPLVGRIASTLRALPVNCCVAVGNTGCVLALTTMHMVRVAAHHQVNYQHRDAQVVGQPDHTTTAPSSPVIGGKVSPSSGKVGTSPPRDSCRNYPICRLLAASPRRDTVERHTPRPAPPPFHPLSRGYESRGFLQHEPERSHAVHRPCYA